MSESDHNVLESEADPREEPSVEAAIAESDQHPDHQSHGSIETSGTEESPDELIEAESLRVELDDVERALARLDDGTYATCEVCGTALEDSELSVSPQLRTCAQHRS
ncbi:MAG: hypothetical protein F2520_05175 [Actinobacteria bacterium]|uniref:Unannotated protein n=1 Tax=freshwater metagenome TaxID=449393 RepID=A0A6J7J036_9ZZZZ|nr:hypothetical protein [Actinomycetota bacterium]MTA77634.1 hypothetical protein [Actinomycetota bacterium]